MTVQQYERYITGADAASQVYGNYWRGQTFTIGNTGTNEDHFIYSAKLQLYRVGSPGIMTVSIRNATDGDLPTGSDLTLATSITTGLGTSEWGTWLEFIFTTPLILKKSTKYSIVARCLDGNSSNYIWWSVDNSSPAYTGGKSNYSQDGDLTWLVGTIDRMFDEYGDSEPLKLAPMGAIPRKIGLPTPINLGLGL